MVPCTDRRAPGTDSLRHFHTYQPPRSRRSRCPVATWRSAGRRNCWRRRTLRGEGAGPCQGRPAAAAVPPRPAEAPLGPRTDASFRIGHTVSLPPKTPPCPLLSAASANTPAPGPAVFSAPHLWPSEPIPGPRLPRRHKPLTDRGEKHDAESRKHGNWVADSARQNHEESLGTALCCLKALHGISPAFPVGSGGLSVWSTFLKIHTVGASCVTFLCLTVLECEPVYGLPLRTDISPEQMLT